MQQIAFHRMGQICCMLIFLHSSCVSPPPLTIHCIRCVVIFSQPPLMPIGCVQDKNTVSIDCEWKTSGQNPLQIIVKSVRPLFAVCSSVCCFEKCFKCGTQVQHAMRMLHYSASHHFFVVHSTYFVFQLDFSCNGPNTEGKESGQEVEW